MLRLLKILPPRLTFILRRVFPNWLRLWIDRLITTWVSTSLSERTWRSNNKIWSRISYWDHLFNRLRFFQIRSSLTSRNRSKTFNNISRRTARLRTMTNPRNWRLLREVRDSFILWTSSPSLFSADTPMSFSNSQLLN